MDDQNIDTSPLKQRVDELRQAGQTVMFVGVDGELAGFNQCRRPG